MQSWSRSREVEKPKETQRWKAAQYDEIEFLVADLRSYQGSVNLESVVQCVKRLVVARRALDEFQKVLR